MWRKKRGRNSKTNKEENIRDTRIYHKNVKYNKNNLLFINGKKEK